MNFDIEMLYNMLIKTDSPWFKGNKEVQNNRGLTICWKIKMRVTEWKNVVEQANLTLSYRADKEKAGPRPSGNKTVPTFKRQQLDII